MTDGRKTLRAEPPQGRHTKPVQLHLNDEDYRKIYKLAESMNTSLSEAIRFSIRYTHDGTINS
jgi:hypothetical protein